MGTTMRVALCVVLATVATARADDEPPQPPAPPLPPIVQPPSTQPQLLIIPPAPPKRTPFDRGRIWLSAGGGEQTLLGSQYFELGAGVGYFVLDGVELGLSGLYELGNGPSIAKLSPSLRYIAQPLVGKWPIVPYVGAFYNHWFIGGGNPDEDTVGARAGFAYVSGSIVLGLGVAVETAISTCTTGCSWIYPDISISLAL